MTRKKQLSRTHTQIIGNGRHRNPDEIKYSNGTVVNREKIKQLQEFAQAPITTQATFKQSRYRKGYNTVTDAVKKYGANAGKNLTTLYAANLAAHQLNRHVGPGAGTFQQQLLALQHSYHVLRGASQSLREMGYVVSNFTKKALGRGPHWH